MKIRFFLCLFINGDNIFNTTETTPKDSIGFSEYIQGGKNANCLAQKTTLTKLSKYIEQCANLFYHNDDPPPEFGIIKYAKMKIHSIEIKERMLNLVATVSIDKSALNKDIATRENYKKWINGANGAFETSWDNRPFENIFLETPELIFI